MNLITFSKLLFSLITSSRPIHTELLIESKPKTPAQNIGPLPPPLKASQTLNKTNPQSQKKKKNDRKYIKETKKEMRKWAPRRCMANLR